jgi:DNA-binding NtrC family response regulator
LEPATLTASEFPLTSPTLGGPDSTVRVLVVSAESTTRDPLVEAVRAEGYDVIGLASGDEALAELSRAPADVVLADLEIAPVTALDVVQAARKSRGRTLAVLITGNPGAVGSVEALRAGAWDYLLKPFTTDHLQFVLSRAAHEVLARRELESLRRRLAREDGGVTADGRNLWPEIVGEKYHTAKERLVAHFENVYLCHLLTRAGGNLARAARMASMDRATLYRLIDKHRIPVPREPRFGTRDSASRESSRVGSRFSES